MFFFPMADQTILDDFRRNGCTAYQGLFASDFLRSGAAPCRLLAGPAGVGKRHVASLIVPYMFEQNLARRVLVLTPSALTQMWHAHLGTCATPCQPSW